MGFLDKHIPVLEGKVAANEAKLAGLKKDTVQAAINQAEADAKAYTDEQLANIVVIEPSEIEALFATT